MRFSGRRLADCRANNDNTHRAIVDVGDDSIVADAVFPERAKPCALQSLADGARVVERGHPIMQEAEDANRGLVAEFVQFTLRRALKLNRPGHAAS